jgi:DMSO/TMAO reductase YedYZ molybdopterin-dependent catalytic subunit
VINEATGLRRARFARMKTWMLTFLALAEFDPGFSDRSIILADQQDGQSLPDNAAPFRVVVPGDSHRARWIRQVKSIEVIPLNE